MAEYSAKTKKEKRPTGEGTPSLQDGYVSWRRVSEDRRPNWAQDRWEAACFVMGKFSLEIFALP
jgi:hypothetical protein